MKKSKGSLIESNLRLTRNSRELKAEIRVASVPSLDSIRQAKTKGGVGFVKDMGAVDRWLAFLGREDCTCKFEWKSLGRLYNVAMGDGWVRMKDDPDCPRHGLSPSRGEPEPASRRLASCVTKRPKV